MHYKILSTSILLATCAIANAGYHDSFNVKMEQFRANFGWSTPKQINEFALKGGDVARALHYFTDIVCEDTPSEILWHESLNPSDTGDQAIVCLLLPYATQDVQMSIVKQIMQRSFWLQSDKDVDWDDFLDDIEESYATKKECNRVIVKYGIDLQTLMRRNHEDVVWDILSLHIQGYVVNLYKMLFPYQARLNRKFTHFQIDPKFIQPVQNSICWTIMKTDPQAISYAYLHNCYE